MITHPALLAMVLLAMEAAVLAAAAHPKTKGFFRYIPAVFWIYFLPMLASSLGLIDPKSPLYGKVVDFGLPASLFMLLLSVDLKAIARLGRTVILMFLFGSLGIILGTVIVFALFRQVVGVEFHSGFGALSASWMGGSANMIAVKEALATPDNIFLPMVVVDTIVPYVWMGVLIFGSTWQGHIDRFNNADMAVLDDARARVAGVPAAGAEKMNWPRVSAVAAIAFGVSLGLNAVSPYWPVVPGVISAFTWTVIIVSTAGLLCSLTKLGRFAPASSTKVGYFMLYFVLTTIGAKASITQLGDSLVLIGAGFLIVFIHGIVLMLAARALRAPVMLAAAASQANVGGVASAPIVAAVYQPGLAAVGLLMAILGNIIGTYLGIVTGQICRLLASF